MYKLSRVSENSVGNSFSSGEKMSKITEQILNDKKNISSIEEKDAIEINIRKNKHLNKYIYIIAASVLGALILAAAIFVLVFSRSVVSEVCEKPDYSHITESSFVSLLCKVNCELDEVDTSSPAQMKIPLKFFGFLKTRSKLTVLDTVSPKIESVSAVASSGIEIKPELFIVEAEDKTVITYSMNIENPVGAGEYTVDIKAVDEGSNALEFSEKLTVIDTEEELTFEYGISVDEVREIAFSLFEGIQELEMPEEFDCGEYVLSGNGENGRYFVKVMIKDTKKPEVQVASFDIALGDTLKEEDFIISIEDFSSVTTEFLSFPDFEAEGEYSVQIRFTDAFGNFTEECAIVRIHNIEKEITVERGSANNVLERLIFKDTFSKNTLSFEKQNVLSGLSLGENTINLAGDFGTVSVKVDIIDTTAPDFSVHSVSYLVGSAPKANDFVSAFFDCSELTFTFETTPASDAEGTFDVTIIATDEAGNTAQQSTTVVFYNDTEPPVLYGYRDFSFIQGESCNFSEGVTAYDSIWGNVTVNVDSSLVDLNTAGTYELKYSATDGSGNTAEVTVQVIIRQPTYVKLDVDCILQKPALPNGCEVVSLAMVLGYNGLGIDPGQLFDGFMPSSPFKEGDPWETYVGDPRSKQYGIGCYAPVVVKTGNDYLASVGSSLHVADVSYRPFYSYTSFIDNGTPVIIWGTLNMNGKSRVTWEAEINGKNIRWLSSSHCLVLIGYTDYTYIFADPLKGIVEYSKQAVEYSFNLNNQQACVIG